MPFAVEGSSASTHDMGKASYSPARSTSPAERRDRELLILIVHYPLAVGGQDAAVDGAGVTGGEPAELRRATAPGTAFNHLTIGR
jgi:hypothetical protein